MYTLITGNILDYLQDVVLFHSTSGCWQRISKTTVTFEDLSDYNATQMLEIGYCPAYPIHDQWWYHPHSSVCACRLDAWVQTSVYLLDLETWQNGNPKLVGSVVHSFQKIQLVANWMRDWANQNWGENTWEWRKETPTVLIPYLVHLETGDCLVTHLP